MIVSPNSNISYLVDPRFKTQVLIPKFCIYYYSEKSFTISSFRISSIFLYIWLSFSNLWVCSLYSHFESFIHIYSFIKASWHFNKSLLSLLNTLIFTFFFSHSGLRGDVTSCRMLPEPRTLSPHHKLSGTPPPKTLYMFPPRVQFFPLSLFFLNWVL